MSSIIVSNVTLRNAISLLPVLLVVGFILLAPGVLPLFIAVLISAAAGISSCTLFFYFKNRAQRESALIYLDTLRSESENLVKEEARENPYFDSSLKYHEHILEFLNGLALNVDRQAIGAADISNFVDKLRASINAQSVRAERISVVAEDMTTNVRAISENAKAASESVEKTFQSCDEGLQTVEVLHGEFENVNETVDSVSAALMVLKDQSQGIQGIADVINGIAEKTNLLALNAAIEAARAGEYGRGFSVVADEVRALANQTTDATAEISNKLVQNHGQSEKASDIMHSLEGRMNQMVGSVKKTGGVLKEISSQANISNGQVKQIVDSMEENLKASTELSEAIDTISKELHHSDDEAIMASKDGINLSEIAEDIMGTLGAYTLGKRHSEIQHVAIATAQKIGKLFEDSIQQGTISEADLFDRNYQEIPGSNPTKYTTGFDAFTDSVLPDIQEPILKQYSHILFAGAVDNNGYFPTHNNCYSQPLTGNYEKDLVNNRTKRLFNDRTGSRCGSNTLKFLLQTYKRDTGEVIHDLSSPIYVNGKHWGGFRIGYKAERQ